MPPPATVKGVGGHYLEKKGEGGSWEPRLRSRREDDNLGGGLGLESIPEGSESHTHRAGFWCILQKWGATKGAALVSGNLCKP